MLPFALTMFLSGKASERVVAKGKPGLVLVAGAAIRLLGLAFLTAFHDQTWHYVVGSAIVGLGSRAGYSGALATNPAKARELATALKGLNLQQSDYLLDGTHFALAHVYTDGYWVAMLFPALVIVATVVSRLRNRDGFTMMLEGAT